jgi:hypothetical protein
MRRESPTHRFLRIYADQIGSGAGLLIVAVLGALIGVSLFGS